MSKEEKLCQFLSNLLFMLSGGEIIVSPKVLRSTRKAIPQEILDYIKVNQDYIDEFLGCIEFIDTIRNPYGIFNYMRNYANEHGTQYKKTININGEDKQVDDYYVEDNPEEYVMCIVDHAALLTPEKGGKIGQAINDLSSKYFIQLRNKYRQIPILIQQQSAAQESVENLKANRLRPTMDGLGDSKLTGRDANVILGLFSPFRHMIPEYQGYDIRFFKDNIRFLEILGGRNGGGGTMCPMYFNGAVNYFRELPESKETEQIDQVKKYITKIRDNEQK